MKKTNLKGVMREMRGEETQEQLAMELNISRELLSKAENGTRKLPADVSRKMMQRKENPRLGLMLRYEYTRTGPVWLDGPNVDLHHASVKEKTIEEMEEAIVALRNFNFARSLKSISHWEQPEAEKVIEEAVEAITALETLVAVMCEKLDISPMEVWEKHYTQLRAKGWLQ